MGALVHAHFAANYKYPVVTALVHALNADCPRLRDALRIWSIQAVSDQPAPLWQTSRLPTLHGVIYDIAAPGCGLSVYPKRALFSHGVRWTRIWLSADYQQQLRSACHDIARILGSPIAVYAPSELPAVGETIEEVIEHLRFFYGEPAGSFDELREADCYLHNEERGYFIDSFGGQA